ncbi:MAG: hypothetical protein M3283_02040, partial [Actinomycetota bacterium]|nr:hypothetical protein [Actinomycetota bacterium]
ALFTTGSTIPILLIEEREATTESRVSERTDRAARGEPCYRRTSSVWSRGGILLREAKAASHADLQSVGVWASVGHAPLSGAGKE